MNPTETKVVADYLIGNFEFEMQATLRVLGAVPADRLDYAPDATSKNGIALARHIVLEDEWLLKSVADGEFAPPPDDSDACGIMTPADAVARYQERIPAALARVRGLSGEQLGKVLDLLGLFQAPGVDMLALALKHSIHHRGQLSSYLRAMGGKVPGIYGPSADTQAMEHSA